MQIIIAMAGSGERFKKAGYKDPKPIIEVDGKPMIEYVVELFPDETDFLFVCREDHLADSSLGGILRHLRPSAKVVGIKPQNLGPVFSLLQAKQDIKDHEPVIVSYCDFNILWNYEDFKKTVSSVDSSSVCYRGFHPHLLGQNLYAGVMADEKLNVLEVREKHSFTPNKMDTWQQTGLFYFSSGSMLKKYLEELVTRKITRNNEYYVSLLYNLMTRDGLVSSVYPVSYFCQWGTPEDLAAYHYWSAYFLSEKQRFQST